MVYMYPCMYSTGGRGGKGGRRKKEGETKREGGGEMGLQVRYICIFLCIP